MKDRLISAEKLLTKYQDLCEGLACINCPFFGMNNRCMIESMILQEQIVDAEPTEEQVKEYCRKRCLVMVNSELFNEMKARWSADPVKHGYWIKDDTGAEYCSNCHEYPYDDGEYHIANWHSDYCPHCGAKMDERREDDTQRNR